MHVEAPFGESRVLLHTCCAPCSSAIIECLMQSGITPTIYYCNPNIYPEEEYLIRKNECTRYAQALGLEIVDDDYDHEAWHCWIAGREDEPERGARCLECFKMRLLRTAEYARDHGFRVITTTLASSRWKSLDQINEAGRWAVATASGLETAPAAEHFPMLCGARVQSQVHWWDQNWRKGGLQPRRLEIIKEYNFYNQLYCGCEYSMKKD